jgi:hypothetical protein
VFAASCHELQTGSLRSPELIARPAEMTLESADLRAAGCGGHLMF